MHILKTVGHAITKPYHLRCCYLSVSSHKQQHSITRATKVPTITNDKLMKSANVQEANVTATVNGMQRYLELHICEGEEKENDPAPIKGKIN